MLRIVARALWNLMSLAIIKSAFKLIKGLNDKPITVVFILISNLCLYVSLFNLVFDQVHVVMLGEGCSMLFFQI